MRLQYTLILLTALAVSESFAQSDTLFQLPMIEVKEYKIDPARQQLADLSSREDQLFATDLSTRELIGYFSNAYLRDYGNKTLSTLSIRGGSSQQSKILWNGADISNPMLGLGDVSLLPSPLFDEIILNTTASNSAYNPIGGDLQLNSKLRDSSHYALGFSAGEFEHYSGFLKGQLNLSSRWKLAMKLFSVSDRQNFPYKEEHASVLLPSSQKHALHLQNGFMGETQYTLNQFHQLKAALWTQAAKREIPPLRTQRGSEAIQSDTFTRGQIEWSSQWDKYHQKTLLSLRNESNHYADPREGIDALNKFNSQQLISQHKVIISENLLGKFGLNTNHTQAQSENYSSGVQVFQYQIYLNPVLSFSKLPLQLDVAVRHSQQNNTIAPLTGHIKLAWQENNHHLAIGFTRAHRFPGLNDLYWEPGGNEDLEPELSHQLNAGYVYKNDQARFSKSIKGNLFYKKVSNWILWAPIDPVIWEPGNILEVTAMGGDLSTDLKYKVSKYHSLSLQLNGMYQFVQNTGPTSTPLAMKDNNLIYMPSHKINGRIIWNVHQFTFSYGHHYRSELYTQPDLSETLAPLHIGQLGLSYTLQVFNQDIQIYFRTYNLWNTSYYFQPNLPAPGIHFRGGILIQKP